MVFESGIFLVPFYNFEPNTDLSFMRMTFISYDFVNVKKMLTIIDYAKKYK